MARFGKNILSELHGTVGEVVICHYNGSHYVRSRPDVDPSKKTPAQIRQQAKLQLAMNFLKTMKGLFKVTFTDGRELGMPHNRAMSGVLKQAIVGEYPNFAIDYSKVQLASGPLQPPQSAAAELQEGLLNFSWLPGDPATDERLILIAHCPEKRISVFSIFDFPRSAGKATLAMPSPLLGESLEAWIACISFDRKKTSNGTTQQK